ncbi:MAG: porin [Thiotrichaceae bacterium]|nr:porin [Thiotrichaceae bacterium]
MKKIILAVAVATILAPMSAAMAETKIYGALRMSALGGGDEDGVVNNASRIGFKGSNGSEGGLTGFYHIQAGVDTDSGAGAAALTRRFAFAGVKGKFGTVLLGRASSPYKMAGLKVDPFYDTSAGSHNGGSNYGLSQLTNGFLNNIIGYVSPKIGGTTTINIIGVHNYDDTTAPINRDLVNLGASYARGPWTASLQHITELDATRAAFGWKGGNATLGLSIEDIDSSTDAVYLSGTYKIAPKTTLAASIGNINSGAVTALTANSDGTVNTAATAARNSGGDGYSLGVFHKLAPKTTITLIQSNINYDDNTTFVSASNGSNVGDTARADRSVTSIGFIQKF